MNRKLKLCILFVLLLSVMTAIFVFSSHPAEKSKELSNGLLDKLKKLLSLIPWFQKDPEHRIRKLAHFIEFMCLGLFSELFFGELFTAKNERSLFCSVVSFVFCSLYACSDEIHQFFVPGRSCELKDVLLDSAGAAIGIAAAFLFAYLLNGKAGHADHEDTPS